MTTPVAVRVDLEARQLEVSGSEAFVTKMVNELLGQFNGLPARIRPNGTKPSASQKRSRSTARERSAARRTGATPQAIAVDLDAKGNVPSIEQFMKDKGVDRENAQEFVTAATYYLIHHKKLDAVQAGQVIGIYNRMGVKKPLNIGGIFNNIKQRRRWLRSTDERGSYALTTAGENFIEHELSREKQQKKK